MKNQNNILVLDTETIKDSLNYLELLTGQDELEQDIILLNDDYTATIEIPVIFE